MYCHAATLVRQLVLTVWNGTEAEASRSVLRAARPLCPLRRRSAGPKPVFHTVLALAAWTLPDTDLGSVNLVNTLNEYM